MSKELTALAQAFRRARLPVRRPSRKAGEEPEETEDAEESTGDIHGGPLDSWVRKHQPQTKERRSRRSRWEARKARDRERAQARKQAREERASEEKVPEKKAPEEPAKPKAKAKKLAKKSAPKPAKPKPAKPKKPARLEKELPAREELPAEEEAIRKRRQQTLSFSVSPEEIEILRRVASASGRGFSSWVRTTLFAAIDEPIPPRPLRKRRLKKRTKS